MEETDFEELVPHIDSANNESFLRAWPKPNLGTSAESRYQTEQSQLAEHQPEIIVVSGLPRSGTSMLMQMLSSGGIEVYSDGQRGADVR